MRTIWIGSDQVIKNRIMKKVVSAIYFTLPCSFLMIAIKLKMNPMNKNKVPKMILGSEKSPIIQIIPK